VFTYDVSSCVMVISNEMSESDLLMNDGVSFTELRNNVYVLGNLWSGNGIQLKIFNKNSTDY